MGAFGWKRTGWNSHPGHFQDPSTNMQGASTWDPRYLQRISLKLSSWRSMEEHRDFFVWPGLENLVLPSTCHAQDLGRPCKLSVSSCFATNFSLCSLFHSKSRKLQGRPVQTAQTGQNSKETKWPEQISIKSKTASQTSDRPESSAPLQNKTGMNDCWYWHVDICQLSKKHESCLFCHVRKWAMPNFSCKTSFWLAMRMLMKANPYLIFQRNKHKNEEATKHKRNASQKEKQQIK